MVPILKNRPHVIRLAGDCEQKLSHCLLLEGNGDHKQTDMFQTPAP